MKMMTMIKIHKDDKQGDGTMGMTHGQHDKMLEMKTNVVTCSPTFVHWQEIQNFKRLPQIHCLTTNGNGTIMG